MYGTFEHFVIFMSRLLSAYAEFLTMQLRKDIKVENEMHGQNVNEIGSLSDNDDNNDSNFDPLIEGADLIDEIELSPIVKIEVIEVKGSADAGNSIFEDDNATYGEPSTNLKAMNLIEPNETLSATKKGKSADSLSAHSRSKQIEHFECVFCHRITKSKYNMKRHIRNFHTDENPFKCDICFKKFADQSMFFTKMSP